MNRAIVNLSTKKYAKGQQRLMNSLHHKTDADILFYEKEYQVGAPKHQDMQYAFKPYALDKARNDGYSLVLWLDASMYVLKSLEPIFREIEETGYFFQNSGWVNERWTTPEQEEYFGTNEGRMISSGVVGLNLRSEEGNEFLDKWVWASIKGMFNGSHEVTRHDQTCASLIIEQMQLKITENNTHWTYGKPEAEYPDNILIVADGIC